MACETGISTRLATLAQNRNITSVESLKRFLDPHPQFCDPFTIYDMQKAVERISRAITDSESIAVFGDYDCDGVTATATLYAYLKSRGANVTYYIPDRILEGYGMNINAVEKLSQIGVSLIVTVDNGINCIAEVEYAKSKGIDVVITDHHLPQNELPNAVAVVDPHRKEDTSECTFLAGVGVAFKLICALNGNKDIDNLLEKYGAFVLLGTVGDVVPLKGENRTICKYGFDVLNTTESVGINALKQISAIGKKQLNASNVPFSLVPRINAAGRMGDSKRAVELLLATDEMKATALATEIDEDNRKRQRLCEKIFSEACEEIERKKLNNRNIILVANDTWHAGVVGIVASKIVETYNRPCILMTRDNGLLHGSGRSIDDFNIFNAVSYASDFTEKFGGHELAVGVTLKAENFDLFYRKLLEYTALMPMPHQKLYIDCVLNPSEVKLAFAESLKVLEPFGAENESPVFAIYNATITAIVPLKGGKYVKLNLKSGGTYLSALCFCYSADNLPFFVGDTVDMAFCMEVGEFRGKAQVSLLVKQLRPNGIDQEEYFTSLNAYYAFISGAEGNYCTLLPIREEFANIFAIIKNVSGITEETLAMRNKISAGKIKVILQTFLQLGLISVKNGKYTVNSTDKKVSLQSADIMKKLLENGCKDG